MSQADSDMEREARIIIHQMAEASHLLEVVSSQLPNDILLAAGLGYYKDLIEQSEEPNPFAVRYLEIVYTAITDLRANTQALLDSVVAEAEDITKEEG